MNRLRTYPVSEAKIDMTSYLPWERPYQVAVNQRKKRITWSPPLYSKLSEVLDNFLVGDVVILYRRIVTLPFGLLLRSGGSRISRRRGANLVGGVPTPDPAKFCKFVCQNERIWTLTGARTPGGAPMDPPLLRVTLGNTKMKQRLETVARSAEYGTSWPVLKCILSAF